MTADEERREVVAEKENDCVCVGGEGGWKKLFLYVRFQFLISDPVGRVSPLPR